MSQHSSHSFTFISQYFKQLVLYLTFILVFIAPSQSYSQIFAQNDPVIEGSGDIALMLLPISALTTTVLLKDYQGTRQFSKSFLLNLGVTGAMKYLINKERPFRGGDYAFPSGHTSVVFQSASFFHRRYGFKYSIPAYIVAGFTGYSRLNAEKHDGYDILAGIIVGIGSTYFFTTPYQREHMELTFSSGDGTYLLGFQYTF